MSTGWPCRSCVTRLQDCESGRNLGDTWSKGYDSENLARMFLPVTSDHGARSPQEFVERIDACGANLTDRRQRPSDGFSEAEAIERAKQGDAEGSKCSIPCANGAFIPSART